MHLPRWAEPAVRRALRARISLTSATWPHLRRLPGDSTRFGPPRRFSSSLPEWAADHPNVDVREVDPATQWAIPFPEQAPAGVPVLFHNMRHPDLFGTWVARIAGGRVVGSDATVIAHDDTVFGELLNSWPKGYAYHKVMLQSRLPSPTRIAGRVAVLGALFANSYYHWLVDIIPRLRLIRDQLDDVDHIVVPSGSRYQRQCLTAAGIRLDRLIEPTRKLHIVADELLVPSLVPRVSEHTVPYLQSLFADQRSAERPFRRLYVTRANMWRRRVANEEELVCSLAPLGFETVVMDGLSVGDQARMFSEAEVVLGPNGSALANIVFSQPGVRMVEIFDGNYMHTGDWELTARAGGGYNLLVVPSPRTSSQWRDIPVPIAELLGLLSAHGIG